jgi:hypothetical protein
MRANHIGDTSDWPFGLQCVPGCNVGEWRGEWLLSQVLLGWYESVLAYAALLRCLAFV